MLLEHVVFVGGPEELLPLAIGVEEVLEVGPGLADLVVDPIELLGSDLEPLSHVHEEVGLCSAWIGPLPHAVLSWLLAVATSALGSTPHPRVASGVATHLVGPLAPEIRADRESRWRPSELVSASLCLVALSLALPCL